MSDPRGQSEVMDLGTLPQVWATVDLLHRQLLGLDPQRQGGQQFTARFIDENQTAGPRTYITVHRLLQVAYDNHLALIGLLQHHGATHWAPWNLMRPVFEASFYAAWILDPDQSQDRRRRGLRAEMNDAHEKKNWVESLVAAGVDGRALEALRRRRDEVGRIYRAESDELGMRWQSYRNINLVDAIPKLQVLIDVYGQQGAALFVSTWRRLSGFQHAMSYALQTGAQAGSSVKIPGGESVFFTIDDEDFVNTGKQVSAMHIAALQLYARRSQQA